MQRTGRQMEGDLTLAFLVDLDLTTTHRLVESGCGEYSSTRRPQFAERLNAPGLCTVSMSGLTGGVDGLSMFPDVVERRARAREMGRLVGRQSRDRSGRAFGRENRPELGAIASLSSGRFSLRICCQALSWDRSPDRQIISLTEIDHQTAGNHVMLFTRNRLNFSRSVGEAVQ